MLGNLIIEVRLEKFCLATCLLMLWSCEAKTKPTSPVSEPVGNVDTVPSKKTRAEQFAWKRCVYDTTKTYVYLTFDDGPQNGTRACLELCKKLQVKATFFMVGEHVNSKETDKLKWAVKSNYPNILLANHSTTHAHGHYNFFYQHPYMAGQDFYEAQKKLSVPFPIIRLPGNNAWVIKSVEKANPLVRPVCRLLDSAGYYVAGWDVEWNFKRKNSLPKETPSKVVTMVDVAVGRKHTHVEGHVVILTHYRMFRRDNCLDSLAKFITLLKSNPCYQFETIDHYPGFLSGKSVPSPQKQNL